MCLMPQDVFDATASVFCNTEGEVDQLQKYMQQARLHFDSLPNAAFMPCF